MIYGADDVYVRTVSFVPFVQLQAHGLLVVALASQGVWWLLSANAKLDVVSLVRVSVTSSIGVSLAQPSAKNSPPPPEPPMQKVTIVICSPRYIPHRHSQRTFTPPASIRFKETALSGTSCNSIPSADKYVLAITVPGKHGLYCSVRAGHARTIHIR